MKVEEIHLAFEDQLPTVASATWVLRDVAISNWPGFIYEQEQ